MYSKHCLFHLLIAAALSCALASAQGPSPEGQAAVAASGAAQAGQAATAGSLHGHITDPTGALIPGAKVTVANSAGKTIATATADSAGSYTVHGLPPGGYVVKAAYTGFAAFESPLIPLANGQSKRVDISMAIEVEQQNVVVTDDTPTVNVEASGNANAIVLKGKDLDALSDDPDELSNELQALAGPSAGPNGGQIFIDGFSGGQLPPKSAIREIRINQNPFSAEYDRLGYGRIEILTKPGTDKLHGQVFAMGNDSSFNTNHVFGTPGVQTTVPSYYSYMFNGTLSGPINKNMSYFLSGERRDIGNANTWLIPEAVLPDSSGTYVNVGPYNVSEPNQRIRTNISGRVDWQLGARNTLTARYGFWSENETNNLNAGSLPSAASNESNTDHTVQLSDAFVVNDHLVNETRAQYERQNENHFPVSMARTISVVGNFTTGGLSTQMYRDHTTRLELQNLSTLSHGAHAIKFGTRLRDYLDANLTTSNYNGSFSFSSPNANPSLGADAYAYMENGLAAGQSYSALLAAHPEYAPISASYSTGVPSSQANMFDAALFAQDDWKVNQRFTLSGGLRWETQNHIADHNDWAPRIGLAYALDGGHGHPPKTVVRAGFGVFYDRFSVNNILNVHHYETQTKIVLNSPACTDTTAKSLETVDMTTCESSGASASSQSVPVRYQISDRFRSPYTSQFGASIERQLTKGANATVTYLHSFGAHQLVTVNANQYNFDAGDFPLDPSGGYIYEYYPEAVFQQNQMIVSVNGRINPKLSLMGFYTLGFADSDGGAGSNASNAYDIGQDYGPATFVSHNQVFVMANYNGPWGLTFNPFMMANSGKPFNITLPIDTLNNFYNQRPSFATASTPVSDIASTPWGNMDTNPAPTDPRVPANLGVGPAGVAFNLRVSRGFGFGPEKSGPSGPNGGGPWGGGDGGGHRGGPPGGGLGPGGLSGGGGGPRGMFGGGSASSRKYALTFSAQALNLFNNINYGGPNGTIGSPYFLRSTTLAGGMFSSGAASRRIFLQAIFSF
ncbi:MAG TPA: TonB-dependent receptor [Terracidiphilus sp.]|nr:TonB-dependent receptor [Terracidiphilus sp.]